MLPQYSLANYVLVTEKIGRKWALQANTLLFLVGAIIMTAATHQLSYICMLLKGRTHACSC